MWHEQVRARAKETPGLPVIAPDTWTIVCVPSRYTVSMLCSVGRGSVVVASTLGLRMVNMYGWTSREKLRVCFFSIPLRSAFRKEKSDLVIYPKNPPSLIVWPLETSQHSIRTITAENWQGEHVRNKLIYKFSRDTVTLAVIWSRLSAYLASVNQIITLVLALFLSPPTLEKSILLFSR